MEKKSTEQILKEMDAATLVAEKDLKSIPQTQLSAVSGWLKKHYIKAGYKRLAKLLIAKTK